MQAIILAAGMGRRLQDLTKDVTKCMVAVNGETLIQRMMTQLDSFGLSRIIVVCGYHADKLQAHILSMKLRTNIVFLCNDVYFKTNNIYSLYLTREYLTQEDTLLLESDLIFEPKCLQALLDDARPNLALVAKYEGWMDGTVIQVNENGKIMGFLDKKQFRFSEIGSYYKTVNLYKFSKDFSLNCYVPFLEAYIRALGENEYYEQVLKVIALADQSRIDPLVLSDGLWYEIDDVHDLEIATTLFTPDAHEKYHRIAKQYGGYWRYPHLLDFCYLVNPYYPSNQMLEEIKANFQTLLTSYPSGTALQRLLASKNFSVKQSYILPCNGAAESILALMRAQHGTVGVISPSFEEYRNRLNHCNLVIYPACTYHVDDLIAFFADKSINSLVIVNPDNPSGNFMPKEQLCKLAQWCQEQSIRLVLDESFVDFAGFGHSMIANDILETYPSLVVIKSISKSFGVPGLRLGVLASADVDLLTGLQKELPIWNLNSFAEFYLQIAGKYEKDYTVALERFYVERDAFEAAMKTISWITVFPSSANYFMIALQRGSAKDLCARLLEQQIYVKDLSEKRGLDGEYIRVAIRKGEENQKLVQALRQYAPATEGMEESNC